MEPVHLADKDALLIVDLQNDFLPGGALAVPGGNEVIPVLNAYIERFYRHWLPVYASRDWHPANHCSFAAQGGPWPPHCIAGSRGAEFADSLRLPVSATVLSKAAADSDAYSAFQGTGLADTLRTDGIERLFIGGLATDYCVRHTVLDALSNGFETFLLRDAIRAVEVHPGDGEAAVQDMIRHGAQPISLEDIGPGRHVGPSDGLRGIAREARHG
jgi:nicotinamidase/pyrazinamidase